MVPESREPDWHDVETSFKALAVFQTLRTNLALVMAFVRRSLPENPKVEQYDIGLLGVPPGEAQLARHAQSVSCFLVALLSQCLRNYDELKGIKPGLEDADLEAFLDALGDRRRFVSGMRKVRNGVFHVKDMKAWGDADIEFLAAACGPLGVFSEILQGLLNRLYEFTSKCFRGELQIHSRFVYERSAEQGIPELGAALEAGDISVAEYEKRFRQLVEEMFNENS